MHCISFTSVKRYIPFFRMQLEKYKAEAEKLRKRIQVLEEEQQVGIQQIDSVQTGANVESGFDKEEPPTKDKKVTRTNFVKQ